MTHADTSSGRMTRFRHYLSGAWADGSNTHQRVRLAMYGVLLLLVVLGILRAVLSQQWQEDRQLDIEVLESISEQRLLAQHLGVGGAALFEQDQRVPVAALGGRRRARHRRFRAAVRRAGYAHLLNPSGK